MQSTMDYYPISLALKEHMFFTHTYMHLHTHTHMVASIKKMQDGIYSFKKGKKTTFQRTIHPGKELVKCLGNELGGHLANKYKM